MISSSPEIPPIEELEAKLTQVRSKGFSMDRPMEVEKTEFQSTVRSHAYILEQLSTYYPHLYNYPIYSIYDAIVSDYKRNHSTAHTMNLIYDAFKYPEYNKYKTHPYNPKARKTTDNIDISKYGMNEKQSYDSQVFNALHFIETAKENPTIQAYLLANHREMSKLETKTRKEKEESQKETMPRPDHVPPGQDGKWSRTWQALKNHAQVIEEAAIRVWQYPPAKDEDDEFYARGIETFSAMWIPGTDLKYVRDTLSYFDIVYEMKEQSIHSAMSKSKIQTDKGKWRKVTREQIADIAPQVLLLASKFTEDTPGLIHFLLYLLNEQKPYSGTFHINRHPKLSESAFGKGSFIDAE
jgi:hypothetical protein